jgi:hypothetical protein
VELVCNLNEIRPDLLLHQQAECRLDIAENTLHYPGKIEWKVKHFVIGSENLGCPGKAGISSSGYYDFKIAESVFKLFDDGFSCVNLAYAYGVKPDTFFQGGVFANNSAKAMRPAGPVASVSNHAIHNHRTQGHSSQQIYKINYNPHRRFPQNNNEVIIFANRRYVKTIA